MKKFKKARVLEIDKYAEIFNKRNQNFRIQKANPDLILAHKNDGFVLPAPEGYGIGSSENFYFSHMYNCIYDCRYCFLQGMFSSANYVIFVNFEVTSSFVIRETPWPITASNSASADVVGGTFAKP